MIFFMLCIVSRRSAIRQESFLLTALPHYSLIFYCIKFINSKNIYRIPGTRMPAVYYSKNMNHPIKITIAPHGHAVTQSPHPTHIRFERSIGGSNGDSCSSSLCVQQLTAAHRPPFPSHVAGSQRSKSILAHFSTHALLCTHSYARTPVHALLYLLLP